MSIRCWIIDDEPAAHKGIEIALGAHSDIDIQLHGYSVTAIKTKALAKPDLVFLDIELPGEDGFGLLDLWPDNPPLIVFITAYNQYAIKAFDNNALDYLLKPIEQLRFDEMMQKVRRRLQEQHLMFKKDTVDALFQQIKSNESQLGLSVKTGDGLYRIKQKYLIYLESIGDHLALYYHDDQHDRHATLITRDSFKRLATELDPAFFFRTHKSFMVNSAHVVRLERGRFGDGFVEMSNQKQVKFSRRYKDLLAVLS
ncbi:LytR/AlgR family response regulator transcription factor [Aliiglaciecola sp. M165]|uniref:LytR/AlgR family response regulator transcription factor n=1 Tax=Aliiglaciecola sp. M165 TaxID=2593649 RepID=UPI0011804342|nr:LytTR family DNA-binding domain-containing protein [Aliiglaciecola sp. M165]TRY31777.1 response regulator transcription factor [Aliiglaciecola sp. M165]